MISLTYYIKIILAVGMVHITCIVVENTRDCAYSTPSNFVHNARLRNVLIARLVMCL